MKVDNILETIGNTPCIRINHLFRPDIEVWMKAERFNPGSSIKDRIALGMIEDAESKGLLNKDTVIVEPTSGNTGIGLALVCAVRGYRLILTMPESMSIERRKYVKALGAELELTPKELGMGGCIEKAKQLLQEGRDIADTAFECGFFDQSHLHRHFKAMTTVTPQEYRVNFIQ